MYTGERHICSTLSAVPAIRMGIKGKGAGEIDSPMPIR